MRTLTAFSNDRLDRHLRILTTYLMLRQQRGPLSHKRSYFSPYWIKKEQAVVRISFRGNPPCRWLHLFRGTEHKERKFHRWQGKTYIHQKLWATWAVALKQPAQQRPHPVVVVCVAISISLPPLSLVVILHLVCLHSPDGPAATQTGSELSQDRKSDRDDYQGRQLCPICLLERIYKSWAYKFLD